MSDNPANYFKRYRSAIGFSNQADARNFLAAKDITPGIDFGYIDLLNERISLVIHKLDEIIKLRNDINRFCLEKILGSYSVIRTADILPRLNNQGRRPEEVLFSWLRGYAICEYFTPIFSQLFNIPISSISQIGNDDLVNIETFKRSPQADLEFKIGGKTIRLEVQSGFQGINDIKEHKVREARRVNSVSGVITVCIHIDVFNGQVAFVRLDKIPENDVNFVTRQQMEGQSVLAIDQNYFKWRLLDQLPGLADLELGI
ncbi:MAG: hypothetical protein JW745_02770 [Sedimentisphaerales bacterium]|nr:hypothetical protein [Sedimentisphaerales bacterium]